MSSSLKEKIAKLQQDNEDQKKKIKRQKSYKEELERTIEQYREDLESCKDTQGEGLEVNLKRKEGLEVNLKRKIDWHRRANITLQIEHQELVENEIELEQLWKARYSEACNHFIISKDSLYLLFLKFLFLGPPRLGKTTACRRLMGEIADLQSAGEAEKAHPSTGTVKSRSVIVKRVSNTFAVITQSDWSAVNSLQDEVIMLFHTLVDTVGKTKSTKTVGESASSPATDNSNQDLEAMVQEVMGSQHEKDVKHMFKAFLRMEDAGGQPELMDMLPLLTIGPGLYLLFINLQNDLDDCCRLTYCNESGDSSPPVESIYTVKEMLLSSLSSISCSIASSSSKSSSGKEEEATIRSVNDILKSSKSLAYIVGTHKDKVSKQRIKKMNDELQRVIESTEYRNFVEFFSEDELIVTMDNMNGGAGEVKKIQALLEKSMNRCFKKLQVPAVWLLFSLKLRKRHKRTAKLNECMRLAGALHMSKYETKVALWFLHHYAGVIMYFNNIPVLKDLVIIDIQVVYDSVTILIIKAKSFDEVGRKDAQKFKETGQFTLSHIIAVTSKVSGDLIPPHKLVALLEFLHIIARISTNQQSSSLDSSGEEDVTYIMPCVLRNATKEELDSISKKPHEVCPIMMRFKCGFVPIGIFPAMIACLINNKSFSIRKGILKNVVQFHYGPFYTSLTLICRPTYYEVIVSKFSTNEIEPHVECVFIRKEMEHTFKMIRFHMNYGSLMDYQFAFECQMHSGSDRDHLCVVNETENVPKMMQCLQNHDDPEPVKLSNEHKVWFGQALPTKTFMSTLYEARTSLKRLPKCLLLIPLILSLILLYFMFGNSSISSYVYSPALSVDERPVMSQFYFFKFASGSSVNIVQYVASECKKLGHLLELPDALVTNTMSNNAPGSLEDKCSDVINEWLKGQGKLPVTWRTFLHVLKHMNLLELVDDLLKELSKLSRGENEEL